MHYDTYIYGTTLGVTGYNPTYNTMHCDTYTVHTQLYGTTHVPIMFLCVGI